LKLEIRKRKEIKNEGSTFKIFRRLGISLIWERRKARRIRRARGHIRINLQERNMPCTIYKMAVLKKQSIAQGVVLEFSLEADKEDCIVGNVIILSLLKLDYEKRKSF
jgi:hypothetical protein